MYRGVMASVDRHEVLHGQRLQLGWSKGLKHPVLDLSVERELLRRPAIGGGTDRRRRGLRWVAAAGALVALAACANRAQETGAGATISPTADPTVDVGGQPIDWENPIVLGIPVQSTDALENDLSFQPILPTLGDPKKLVVNDPEAFDKLDRGFGAQYGTADLGTFWLLEEPSDMTQKELEGLASQCDPAQGCEGKWSLATLDDGTIGLLIDGPTSVGIVWLHNGLYLDVIGQPGAFTSENAIAAANAVVAQY
jgi:hypothetical protein